MNNSSSALCALCVVCVCVCVCVCRGQLSRWIMPRQHDIYAIGLQECTNKKAWVAAINSLLEAEPWEGLGSGAGQDTSGGAAAPGSTAATSRNSSRGDDSSSSDDDDNDGDGDDGGGGGVAEVDAGAGRGQRRGRGSGGDRRGTMASILALRNARFSLAAAELASRSHTELVGGYRTVCCVSLWGIHLVVIVRTELATRITEVRACLVLEGGTVLQQKQWKHKPPARSACTPVLHAPQLFVCACAHTHACTTVLTPTIAIVAVVAGGCCPC